MENHDLLNSLEFTDSERLQLHKLLTKRALVAQIQKQTEKIVEKSDSTNIENMGENEKWQLIPPKTQLYDWQRQCLKIWLPKSRGTVKVATGGGKTLFALAAAQQLQNEFVSVLKLAIVVPTIPLMNQWRDELNSSNLHDSQIGLLGGGNQFVESDKLKIIIAVINSAREKLPQIIKSLNWSDKLLLIVDECHRSNANEAQKIFNTKPKYTLGLSATPEVNSVDDSALSSKEEPGKELELLGDADYSKSAVGKALGEIIFDFSLKDCLEAGLLTKFNVFHVGLDLNATEAEKHAKMSLEISELRKELQIRHRKIGNRQNFIAWCQTLAKKDNEGDAARFIGLANERKRLLYSADSRKNFSVRVLKAAVTQSLEEKNDSKAIVFHESISDVNEIYLEVVKEGLPAVLEQSNLPSGVRTESIELFRKGITRIIVSAKSLVEGFNVPSADIGIIAASSGSVRQRIQSLGRMLRRSDSASKAVIFVLYIKGTEDESIFEKEDWESVLGVERNRYFHWSDSETNCVWPKNIEEVVGQLKERKGPPRSFRPSCRDVDSTKLLVGDKYPAQTFGISVRVDESRNLKSADGLLVRSSKEQLDSIVSRNQFKSATITPCGHLICRDSSINSNDCWVYLGTVKIPEKSEFKVKEKYRVKTKSGRKVIAKIVGRDEFYARNKDRAKDPSAGELLEDLLQWVAKKEAELGISAKNLFWDGEYKYWIEIEGNQIMFENSDRTLEFSI